MNHSRLKSPPSRAVGRCCNCPATAWLVIDELNYTTTDNLVDFAGLSPLGAFSASFLATIARSIRAVRARGRLAIIKRR